MNFLELGVIASCKNFTRKEIHNHETREWHKPSSLAQTFLRFLDPEILMFYGLWLCTGLKKLHNYVGQNNIYYLVYHHILCPLTMRVSVNNAYGDQWSGLKQGRRCSTKEDVN